MSAKQTLEQLAEIYGFTPSALCRVEKHAPCGRDTMANPDGLFFHLLTRNRSRLRTRLAAPSFREKAKAQIDLLSIRGEAPDTISKTDSIQ